MKIGPVQYQNSAYWAGIYAAQLAQRAQALEKSETRLDDAQQQAFHVAAERVLSRDGLTSPGKAHFAYQAAMRLV
jgi:hypothetical protein